MFIATVLAHPLNPVGVTYSTLLLCPLKFMGKGRDSEIAPTSMLHIVGGNSDSRLLYCLNLHFESGHSTTHITPLGLIYEGAAFL